MIFYKPTGPLSGVTTCAIVVWLAAWAILHCTLAQPERRSARFTAAAFVLLYSELAAHISAYRGLVLDVSLRPGQLRPLDIAHRQINAEGSIHNSQPPERLRPRMRCVCLTARRFVMSVN
jgi:hypothetical protein